MHLVFATGKSCGESEMLVGCWLETGDRALARAWNHKQRLESVNEIRLNHQCYRSIAAALIILIIVLWEFHCASHPFILYYQYSLL